MAKLVDLSQINGGMKLIDDIKSLVEAVESGGSGGNNADATKIQGKTIPAPTPSEDLNVIQYNNTTGEFQYADITSPINTRIDDVDQTIQELQGQLDTNRSISFFVSGDLAIESNVVSFIAPINMTIKLVRLSVDTAPTGANLITDINKNGTTIFTAQANRPSIIAGSTTGSTSKMDIATVFEGDKITLDIDQVGSTTVGKNLAVSIVCVAI
jgi:hypothetical protein